MARSLLVAPVADHSALARTCLGLLRALDRRGVKVAFVKPVAQPSADGGPDRSAELVAAVTALRPPEPLSTALLEQQLGEGELDVVLEKIVAAWEPVYGGSDVVVIQGLSPAPSRLYASSLNQALARALDADVVLAGYWPADGDAEELAEQFAIAASGYVAGEQARVVGCVIHGLPAADAAAAAGLRAALARRQLAVVAAVPYRPELTWPRIRDLVRHLHPRILHEGDMSRRIRDVAVFAAGHSRRPPCPGHRKAGGRARRPARRDHGRLPDRAERNPPGRLAAEHGDRPRSQDQRAHPGHRGRRPARPAGGGRHVPYRHAGARSRPRACQSMTWNESSSVTDNIADALDPSWLESLTGASRSRRLSPAAFRYQLAELARAADALVVLPEGTEPRTIRAAVACAERGIARCLLLGSPDEVAARAGRLGLRLPEGVTVLDPQAVAERYVAPLAELRRHKGWTEEVAREHLADPVTVGTMMLQQGEVDGLVSGAVHTTASTVRPALQIIGPKPGARLVSSVFFMCLPDEVVVYGDCAINPQPDAEDLADIAIQSAASARLFGIEPRVAMISFSTGTSGTGSDVDKVAEATRIVREREPDLLVDGPLQYDAAAIASVGQAKRPGSPVAGRASVFVFPDLDTGNTTYKAVQRSARVVSIGPMLQGLAKPVNDLSRGALVEDIIYTIALTAIQARAT